MIGGIEVEARGAVQAEGSPSDEVIRATVGSVDTVIPVEVGGVGAINSREAISSIPQITDIAGRRGGYTLAIQIVPRVA